MRWSQYFIPTLREDPADAEVVSHKLLLRAGIIRQLAAGIYSYLPLGQRIALKVMQILREEMNAIGGQEFFLPALHPAEIWQESGRWQAIGDDMFRFKDRKGADMCLGMTHEEVFTSIARNELRSYKQLPQCWYQIQIKFRDEARPKSGLMRLRTFIMKDAYSFDIDRAGLDQSFANQREAYKKIFTRCGIQFLIVEASSGAMGGSESSEFMARTPAGEDLIVHCVNCDYAANLEKATSRLPVVEDGIGPTAPEEFPTPGVRTIEDLTTFPGGAEASRQIKSLVFMATADGQSQPVLVLMRGDHQLHETKLADSLRATAVRPAQPDEIRELLGASAGSLGGVGAKDKARAAKTDLKIVADSALKNRRNMTTGANKDDHHLRGVDIARDIPVDEWFALRTVESGEGCPRCDVGVLEVFKGMEIGHIFKLGTKYSESMGATVLNQDGKPVPIIMGSYGIGVERIITAAVEQRHDEDGIVWPKSLTPFDVIVTVTNLKQDDLRAAGEKLYADLQRSGLDVLLDDRDERAGVKFKDADLIGIPYRITIGKKAADGVVELFDRKAKTTVDVKLANVVEQVQKLALSGS
ncbi:MAG TPA: proline--tRNA ligase [Pyrinomonadaceae bacterium]|jgi:prolyl-tRNA synthetase, family II|nr:proline--tRNA ligase [Pyrinomonadaceae bacterium]